MRRFLGVLLAASSLLGAPAAGLAQPAADSSAAVADSQAAPATPGLAVAAPVRQDAGAVVAAARRLAEREPWFAVPDVAPTAGARTIAAGERVAGDVAVHGGNLEVHGTLAGSAVAYDGDVVLRPGGSVTGDAIAVRGRVRLEGGTVGGEIRSLRGSLEPAPAVAARSAVATMRGQLGLVVGWFAILVLMGVGVLVFANGPLEGVVERLERSFGAALLAGLAAQLALLPALLLLIVALAITIIGALLIPFAVVGYVIAATGLMTLGFLAVARVIGGALTGVRGSRLTERGSALRGLVVGIAVFLLLWLVAALLTPAPLAATVVRAIAFALTWVATTAGFGAAILSRAGTRRTVGRAPAAPEPPEEELSWQTPTPIGGVAAARRPTSSAH